MAEIKKSTHKNASRSRRLIKQAFGELLNEKPLSKITVTDIVERADISRGTFYAHYLDVFDLYTAIQNNIIEALDAAFNTLGIENIIVNPSDAIRWGMRFLSENKNYFSLFMTSSHSEMLIERSLRRIEDKIYALLQEHMLPSDEIPVRCFMIYTLGAFRGVLIQWFSGELDFSGEECADCLIDIYTRSRPREIIALVSKFEPNAQDQIG